MNDIEERKSRMQRKNHFHCLVDVVAWSIAWTSRDWEPFCGLGETPDKGNTHEMQLIFIKNTSIVSITWSTKHRRKGSNDFVFVEDWKLEQFSTDAVRAQFLTPFSFEYCYLKSFFVIFLQEESTTATDLLFCSSLAGLATFSVSMLFFTVYKFPAKRPLFTIEK